MFGGVKCVTILNAYMIIMVYAAIQMLNVRENVVCTGLIARNVQIEQFAPPKISI